MTTQALEKPLTTEEIDRRINVLEDAQIIDLNLRSLHLHDTKEVNALYDRLEERIDATDEELWFFLISYSGTRIDPAAWVTFARRGRMLKTAHSMGTARVDPCPETVAQIRRTAGTDAYDPNLFADRDSALTYLASLSSKRRRKVRHTPTYSREQLDARITVSGEERILEVDFSDLVFHHSRDVIDMFDAIEDQILRSGKRWFVLLNYNGCRIEPAAWVAYARRGKRLSEGGSLGLVRYGVGLETEADIRLRAQTGGVRPNIRNTRTEALERIEEMKRGA